MTRTINIGEVKNSLQTLIALTKNGDEIVLGENGKPLAKIVPLGDDLESEFSNWEAASEEDFLKFESELAETN